MRPRLFGLVVVIAAMLVYSAALVVDGAAAARSPRAARQAGPSLLSTLSARALLRPSTGLAARPAVRSSFPAPGTASLLVHAACTSASNCWAVGEYVTSGGADLNQALHWNGKHWSQVSTPEPGGTASGKTNVLYGVACTSASNCWAVGQTNFNLNQALHWNGKKWSAVPTPQPGGTTSSDTNELLGVACTSASSCWAVGYTEAGSGPQLNQALHWNGTTWSQVSTPEPGGTLSGDTNELGILGGGVACTSASSCWAVGFTQSGSGTPQLNQALHWDGTAWTQVSTPEPGGTSANDVNELTAVACSAASNCSAVGFYRSGSGPRLNEALHWDGHKWASAQAINPGGASNGALNELIGAACPAAANCWAVGAAESSGAAALNEALHWTGGAWFGASTPQPGGTNPGDINLLIGVACVSTSDCWSVGAAGINSMPTNEILHWNGKKWALG